MQESVKWIGINEVRVNPYQPRRSVQEADLAALAESIRVHGILQPLLVRRAGEKYELIAGERRWRAAQIAGLGSVPVVILDAEARDLAVLALVENLQREELTFWDQAEGFFHLQREFQMSQSEIARVMGLSQSAVANKLRILNLEPGVRARLQTAGLSERHARVLLMLPRAQDRTELCNRMIAEGWTVKEAEAWVKKKLAVQEGDQGGRRQTVVKDFRIIYNAFKKTLAAVEKSGMAVEMSHSEAPSFWEIRVRIPKKQEG